MSSGDSIVTVGEGGFCRRVSAAFFCFLVLEVSDMEGDFDISADISEFSGFDFDFWVILADDLADEETVDRTGDCLGGGLHCMRRIHCLRFKRFFPEKRLESLLS